MKKLVKPISVSYSYDANRSGAHYTIDGEKYMNHGDLMECLAKAVHGLEPKKDGNTPFNKESDIPEYHASVKSSAATLNNKVLAKTFNGTLKKYFEETVSTEFWFVHDVAENLYIYKMNADEFKAFLKKFGKLNERTVIRINKISKEMVNWLESKVEA